MRNERDLASAGGPGAAQGVGARLPRKEDERFMRGRGQFVADIRLAGLQEVAFVRSPLAHARIRRIHVPERFRANVFTAADLTGVNPICAVSGLPGFKISEQPVLATDKVRQVGELVAMCWWDDLWLKESFADFMGTYAQVEATRWTNAWVGFANRRKAWAYRQDQLATTHPIVATIDEYHLMLGPALRSYAFNFEATVSKVARVWATVMRVVSFGVLLALAGLVYRFTFFHQHGGTNLIDTIVDDLPELEFGWWLVMIVSGCVVLLAAWRIVWDLMRPEVDRNKRPT